MTQAQTGSGQGADPSFPRFFPKQACWSGQGCWAPSFAVILAHVVLNERVARQSARCCVFLLIELKKLGCLLYIVHCNCFGHAQKWAVSWIGGVGCNVFKLGTLLKREDQRQRLNAWWLKDATPIQPIQTCLMVHCEWFLPWPVGHRIPWHPDY